MSSAGDLTTVDLSFIAVEVERVAPADIVPVDTGLHYCRYGRYQLTFGSRRPATRKASDGQPWRPGGLPHD